MKNPIIIWALYFGIVFLGCVAILNSQYNTSDRLVATEESVYWSNIKEYPPIYDCTKFKNTELRIMCVDAVKPGGSLGVLDVLSNLDNRLYRLEKVNKFELMWTPNTSNEKLSLETQ